MSFYEMETGQVYASGQATAAQAGSATAVAGQYLSALANAHDPVHHPTVVAAVGRYRGLWQPRINEVAPQIDALSTNTGSSATVVADSDADATTLLTAPALTVSDQGSALTRPVNI